MASEDMGPLVVVVCALVFALVMGRRAVDNATWSGMPSDESEWTKAMGSTPPSQPSPSPRMEPRRDGRPPQETSPARSSEETGLSV
jgi:hypothetical protein